VLAKSLTRARPAIQRTVGDGHDLTAARSIEPSRDEDLEACYDDEARLTMGEMGQPGKRKVNSGPAVQKVQAALIELGLLAAGGDTGVYTQETWNAVKQLKKTNHLGWESMGDVGPGTMDWLNKGFTTASVGTCPPRCPEDRRTPGCPACPPTPFCPPCPEEPRTPGCEACPPPKPAPQPRANCSDEEAGRIAGALTGAIADLNSALGMLDQPSPLRDDVLWLAFRSTGEGDIPAIRKVLTAVAGGLPTASIECSDPGILICASPTEYAATNSLTGTIFICRSRILQLDGRTLVHEGCHAFGGLNAGGELYHDDDCGEGDVAGQTRAFRLQNADSFACFVELLTHSAETNLAARVQHSKGGDLALGQKPPGDIKLSGPETAPSFSLVGFSEMGIKGVRWILRDDADRKYLLRRESQIIAPDTEVDWVEGIIIGAKTRVLLQERGVSQAHLLAVSRIPEVGQKAVELTVTLVP